MTRYLCVTPNPAVDRTLIVPQFKPGGVSRAVQTIAAAGGKGLNVARAIRILGGEALCAGFLGGHSGRLVAELAEREGLRGAWTWIEGETRACVILVDRDATVVNEPGPSVTAEDWTRLHQEVLAASAQVETICFSGSLPPGSPLTAFVDLVRSLVRVGKPVWVDTSGAALEAVLPTGANVKVNDGEASAIAGCEVTDRASAAAAALALRRRGAGIVVLTLGASGALIVTDEGQWFATPPAIEAVSAVGSGDAFLAGLVTAWMSGTSPAQAVCHAVAAGAANALSPGGGRFTLQEFETTLSRCECFALAPDS